MSYTTLDSNDQVIVKRITAEDRRELNCLARTIYHESRGEKLAGQMAVAWTTLNRTENEYFPDTICEVVKQKNQFPWVEKNLKIKNIEVFERAKDLAREMIYKFERGIVPHEIRRVENALYFNVASIDFLKLPKVKIGAHTFYLQDT